MVAHRLFFLLVVVLILSPIEQMPMNFGITGAQGMCPADAPSELDHNFRFFGVGQTCDGTFPLQPIDTSAPLSTRGCQKCCKNFLSCIDNPKSGPVCTELYQGMACDISQVGSCGGSMTCTQVNATSSLCLLSAPLENGGLCYVNDQCLSQFCNGTGYCSAETPLGLGDNCEVSTQCPPTTWCNASKQCGAPLPVGSTCNLYEPLPNWQCAPGSGCHQDPSSNNASLGRCTIYYSGKASASCNAEDGWWNCGYGSVCSNSSNKFVCTEQPTTPLKTQCSAFPFSESDFKKCPVGATCGCFANNKTKPSQCEIYINTNCVLQLSAVYTCLVNNKCPHDPATLIGGNPSSFAGPAVLGSCVDRHCRNRQAHLINCQNVAIASNLSPAYAPKVGPSAYKEEGSDDLQEWQIGLMIVAGADFVIIVLSLAAISLRQAFNF